MVSSAKTRHAVCGSVSVFTEPGRTEPSRAELSQLDCALQEEEEEEESVSIGRRYFPVYFILHTAELSHSFSTYVTAYYSMWGFFAREWAAHTWNWKCNLQTIEAQFRGRNGEIKRIVVGSKRPLPVWRGRHFDTAERGELTSSLYYWLFSYYMFLMRLHSSSPWRFICRVIESTLCSLWPQMLPHAPSHILSPSSFFHSFSIYPIEFCGMWTSHVAGLMTYILPKYTWKLSWYCQHVCVSKYRKSTPLILTFLCDD